MKRIYPVLFVFVPYLLQVFPTTTPVNRKVKKITYNNVSVDVVIDKPEYDSVDVILTYHGTVLHDNKILEAANRVLDNTKKITQRKDIMFISVAYPEEGLLMGDNIKESEAALLWVKNNAAKEIGVFIRKIFLFGHSQGGYVVTRLNTMHETDGVIANAPGPLNFLLRCQLEEKGTIKVSSPYCRLMFEKFGSVSTNPAPYEQRSLLYFTKDFKSDILFVQGLNDGRLQMISWPIFKKQVNECTSCKESQFYEIAGKGHGALFESEEGQKVYNEFINR